MKKFMLSAVLMLVPTFLSAGSDTVFFLKPCRVVDTRLTAVGFTSSFSFKVRGNPAPGSAQGGSSNCGVPDNTDGVILNLTIITPAAAGHAILWPSDQSAPSTSTIIYSTLTNNNDGLETRIAALPASSGDLSISSSSSAYWVVDIAGYKEKQLRQKFVATITNAPHASPTPGVTVLIINGTGGVFIGHDNEYATWNGSAWTFDPPQDGDLAYEAASGVYIRYKATGTPGWKLLDCDCP